MYILAYILCNVNTYSANHDWHLCRQVYIPGQTAHKLSEFPPNDNQNIKRPAWSSLSSSLSRLARDRPAGRSQFFMTLGAMPAWCYAG